MKKVLFLFIIFSFLGADRICAKTIIISDKTSDKQIGIIISKIQPGDTLFFKTGYYNKNIKLANIHGLPDIPIVFRGESRANTVIDGGAPVPGSSLTNYGFLIENCSWLTIDNLSFKNCWLNVIHINNSSYISLRNSNIDGGRRAMYAQGRKSHHFLIENCYWEQGEHVWTKEGKYSWEELHHGEYRHYNGGLFQAKMIGGSFVLRDNYIKNVYNGFRLSIMGDAESDTLACTNGEIYRNVIENSADNAFEPEVYCKNLHFYHNRMINSHAFISVTEVGGGPLYFYSNTGVKLPDCNDGWTIFKFTDRERSLTRPFYIFNNSWQVDSDVLGRIQEKHWKNDNIYHFNNAYYITNADTVGIYYLGKNNVFENDCANIPFPDMVTRDAKHKSIIADPMFIDGAYGNFLLKKESPCRDAGIIPAGLDIGFIGDKLDIGAYDDDLLVEGPPFRFQYPGEEMPDPERPAIVRHKVVGNSLKLWFSYPLDNSTIDANNFEIENSGTNYVFDNYSLDSEGYLLTLISKENLPVENISLKISRKPKGTNGMEVTTWASTLPVTNISLSEHALNITRKVADNIIRTTTFAFEPKVVTFNANVSRLRIEPEILPETNQVGYGLITIHSDQAKETTLGFSFRGDIKLFLNNKQIYAGKSGQEEFKEYTYNRFKFSHNAKINLYQGENKLLVKFAGGDRKGTDFSCCVLKPNGQFDTEVQIKNSIENSYINNWLVALPFVADEPNAMDKVFDPEENIRTYYKSIDKIISWQMQSPMVQQAFTISWNRKSKKGFNPDWHYANSNTLLGMMNFFNATQDYNYKSFVAMYNKHVVDNYDFFKEQYFSKRIMRGAYFRLYRATMLDDTGGAILPFAEMALSEKKKHGLKGDILDSTLDYVLHKQARLQDGTLCRPEPINETVWADDLFMSVPFLLRMAKINSNPKLYDEAAFQIIKFNKYLTDKKTNLYRHGWYNETQQLAPVAWARANGWIVWASSEALLEMPASHKDYKKIKELFVNHLEIILSYQSSDGMWHQVIDCPDSYTETSASAMFALALSRAIRNKWISGTYTPALLKAWEGISGRIDTDGTVQGICRGTDMGEDAQYYIDQKPLESDPRGLGAVLTLGTEMYYFFQEK